MRDWVIEASTSARFSLYSSTTLGSTTTTRTREGGEVWEVVLEVQEAKPGTGMVLVKARGKRERESEEAGEGEKWVLLGEGDAKGKGKDHLTNLLDKADDGKNTADKPIRISIRKPTWEIVLPSPSSTTTTTSTTRVPKKQDEDEQDPEKWNVCIDWTVLCDP